MRQGLLVGGELSFCKANLLLSLQGWDAARTGAFAEPWPAKASCQLAASDSGFHFFGQVQYKA